jgi:diguanylate cyclase (GGDEF)-like protein/PAS domain S-box-containing protein
LAEERGFELDLKAAIEALRRSTQQYRLLADQAVDGLLLVTSGGRLLNVNAACAQILGYSRDQLLKMRFSDFLAADQKGEDPLALLLLKPEEKASRGGRLSHRDGHAVEALLNATRLADGRLQIVVHDHTEERRALAAVREAEERYERLAESSPDAVLVEADGRVVFANGSAQRLPGRTVNTSHPDLLFSELIHPEDREVARERLGRAAGSRTPARVVFRLTRRDGELVETEGAATAVSYRGLPAVQVVLRDTGEERRAAPPASSSAVRDLLTGLPGQVLVADRLAVALSQAYRHRARVGLLLVDIDHFSNVNTAIGRSASDRLLRAAARRLSFCVREGDTVARLENAQFALLVPGLRHAEDASKIADKVVQSLRRPFPLRDRVGHATASVGIAVFPDDGEDAPGLMRAAEAALRKASASGGDRFEPRTGPREEPGLDAMELEAGLRAALGRGGMSINRVPARPGVLYYQPFYSVSTGKLTGVEALLRWQHPQLGLVFPQDFLSKSDFAGLILAIGPWIMRAACLQARAWQRQKRGLRLAVNLAGPEMLRHDLVEQIRAALYETGLAPKALQVEVNESYVMEDVPRAEKTLRRLRDLGVGVVLDRFGVGYASLSRLAQLSADAVKLDLAFSRGTTTHTDDASLLAAVVAVARSLKLRVMAQGIENQSQLALLRKLGCDEVQGFLMSPPVDATACEKLLE